MIQKAHAAGVPVFKLTKEQIGEAGLVLSQIEEKRDILNEMFLKISEVVVEVVQ